MKKTGPFRRAATAAVALVAIVPLTAATTPNAVGPDMPNDPGYCAVRVSGPSWAGADYTYTMRNKCTTAWTYEVYLPASGRYATSSATGTRCQSVGALAYATYFAATADPNWTPVLC